MENPHLEMDDDWGYPYYRKPPFPFITAHCMCLGGKPPIRMGDRHFPNIQHCNLWLSPKIPKDPANSPNLVIVDPFGMYPNVPNKLWREDLEALMVHQMS